MIAADLLPRAATAGGGGKAPAGWRDVLPHPAPGPDLLPDPDQPFVLLDDARDEGAALLFRNPREIVAAHRLEEIVPALERLREGQRQGAHVAGYLAYDAGFALEPRLTPLHRASEDHEPLLWFGLFDPPRSIRLPSPAGPASLSFRPAIARPAYCADVARILALIEAGDCYQVNFTFEAELDSDASPLAHYLRLRGVQQAGWGGMLSTGQRGLLSCSPELFFTLEQGLLRTRPMKGTARRGRTPQEDHALRQGLRANPKELAENLMIVDLLRNDMARVAMPGSVRVDDLFAIETYPTIHQMTSSISARLRAGLDGVDVIRHLFPCGSITGAPKIRAMEIIAACERRSRGFYTGAMGFLAPDGSAAFNVLIRSLEYRRANKTLRFGVGSGIVRDSIPGAEWAECHAKAAFLDPPVRSDCRE